MSDNTSYENAFEVGNHHTIILHNITTQHLSRKDESYG